MLTDSLEKELLHRLLQIDPLKIILFGSYAYGEPGPDSDVDLLVVTQDEFLPNSFSEKNAVYLRVAQTMLDIEKYTPIDLIVHTQAMHKKFLEMNSMFCRKILTEGKVLYEKAH